MLSEKQYDLSLNTSYTQPRGENTSQVSSQGTVKANLY